MTGLSFPNLVHSTLRTIQENWRRVASTSSDSAALITAFCSCTCYVHCDTLSDSVTGDIGGYLGLLIGGSALTIIELVDLVFYNAFLKFIGKA